MPTPGLSLVGFLDRQPAIELLRNSCVVQDTSDHALEAEWQAAKDRLGPPMDRAGYPEILPIPSAGQAHMSQLLKQPWVIAQMSNGLSGAQFQMVELDPLLAFQYSVDLARSDHHNGDCDKKPTTQQLFEMCLPAHFIAEGVRVNRGESSVLITSDGLNFRVNAQGLHQTPVGDYVGVQVAMSLPLLHVVRLNGRCYLHNGFHRAVGLSRRGVTHAPCVFRDVQTAASAAITPPYTFGLDALESANPPTVGHFAQGRAYDVTLKVFTRTIHVSWADHVTTRD